ncbi:hypothetical protein D3C81_595870 [compost metagenome]
MQGRLAAAPAGAPVRRQHRLPAEVVRQPGAQPLEIELAQGKLQAALGGRDLAALDAEAGLLGAQAEVPHGQLLSGQVQIQGPGGGQGPALERGLHLEIGEGAAPAIPAQAAIQTQIRSHRIPLHGQGEPVAVEIATQVQGYLGEHRRPLHQARHRQGQLASRFVPHQSIALDGRLLEHGSRIGEAARGQIHIHPRCLLVAGDTHLSLEITAETGVDAAELGGIYLGIQLPGLGGERPLGLQLVGAALQRQGRDGPLHLVVAAERSLERQGILVELAVDLELRQRQLPVARLVQLEAAGYLARQRPLDLGHQLGRVDPLEFGGPLPLDTLAPGELAIEPELPLQGAQQQLYLAQLLQIPLARERHLEGGHVRPLAGGLERKLIARELALGAQGALVQPVAGLILDGLVKGPCKALPVQCQIEGQVGVQRRQRPLEVGRDRPLGLERQPQLAHGAIQSQVRLLGVELPLLEPLAGLGIQGQGEGIIRGQADMALERQIRHGVAQGELTHLDALILGLGRQQQLVDSLDELPLLIAHPGRRQAFQLDGEWQADLGQLDGGGRLWLRLGGRGLLGLGLGLGRALRLGRLAGGRLGRLVGSRGLVQGHVQAIEHGPAHYEPLAIQGGADVEGGQGHPNAGHVQVQIRHLEAVHLDAQWQRAPDEGLGGLFRHRLSVGDLHHRVGDRQGLDPELALQQLAEIPVQHGPLDGDVHQLVLPADPFQGPAIAELARHQLPLEGRQRPFGLLPQPLVALMGEAQQADADEQQEDEPHEPQENTLYPDHSADPRERGSRSGQEREERG